MRSATSRRWPLDSHLYLHTPNHAIADDSRVDLYPDGVIGVSPELFIFKCIKWNLTIKSLWGYSENAVNVQLWIAICSYLLLAWLKAEHKSPLTITEISKIVEASILSKADLKELLDVPEPLTQNQNINELF